MKQGLVKITETRNDGIPAEKNYYFGITYINVGIFSQSYTVNRGTESKTQKAYTTCDLSIRMKIIIG